MSIEEEMWTDEEILEQWEEELKTVKENKRGRKGEIFKILRGEIKGLGIKIERLSLIEGDLSKKMNRKEIKIAKPVEELGDKILSLCRMEIKDLKDEKEKKEKELERDEVEIAYLNKKLKLIEELTQ